MGIHIRLAEHGVSAATNPASNMKLGGGFAPVPELMDAGVNVCLGTDGAARRRRLHARITHESEARRIADASPTHRRRIADASPTHCRQGSARLDAHQHPGRANAGPHN